MGTVKNFEELQAWQKARVLADFVYELTRKEKFSRDWALCNQIRDAAGSVMHNIAEGFSSRLRPRICPLFKDVPTFRW